MNARAFLVIPAAVAVAVLAGCGQTEGQSSSGGGSESTQVRMPSTEICRAPAYIRDRAPEGFCGDTTDVDPAAPPAWSPDVKREFHSGANTVEPSGAPVDDDLSPLRGIP